jgi:hypothetical protein
MHDGRRRNWFVGGRSERGRNRRVRRMPLSVMLRAGTQLSVPPAMISKGNVPEASAFTFCR